MEHFESLVDVLRSFADSNPEGTPFCYLADGETEEQPLSYQAFDEQAQAVAAELQARQLQGERVLLLFPQGLEYLISLFGCFYAGAIAVPAYPPRSNHNLLRLLAIMDSCEARHILADQDGISHIQRLKQDFSGYELLAYEDLVAAGSTWDERPISGEATAYLQYTSGSTGTPKGVIVTHANMMANIEGLKETYYPYSANRMVSWIPMYHDMGLLSMMTAFTIPKSTCYFMSPVHFVQKPARWLQAMSRYRANYSVGPNFAYDLCCEKVSEADMEGLDLSALKSITTGSEQVRLSTLRNFYQKFSAYGFDFMAFCPGYGLAEATLGVSVLSANEQVQIVPKTGDQQPIYLDEQDLDIDEPDQYWVSNGHIVRGADVKIVDAKTQMPMPESQEGEIWVHHPGFVSKGYWGQPEASKAAFYNYLPGDTERRYLRTGDLGFLLNGEVFVTGRLKDMIIIRGRNYYPQDIELAVTQAHPALSLNACAAFAVDSGQREALVIVQEVSRTAWREAVPEAVIEAIRQTLAEAFEIQAARIFLIRPISLPKTSSGKIQRYAARQQMLDGQLRVLHAWEQTETAATEAEDLENGPITQTSITVWLQQKIAEKARMSVQDIDLNQSVKDYPLESIDAIFLSDELSEWLEVKVSPDTFWAFSSISELAAFLAEQHQASKD